MLEKFSLLLLGCGHMGSAMLKGWQEQQLPIDLSIVRPSITTNASQQHYALLEHIPEQTCFDVVIIAVPPQIADQAMQGLAKFVSKDSMVVSIMAGKSLHTLQKQLAGHRNVVRVMPNIPSSIGKGICGYVCAEKLTEIQQNQIDALLTSTGIALALDAEDDINKVTAVSGSGPAYAFLLIKAMTDAAIHLGLSDTQARTLALHTVAGAGQYALHSGEAAEQLLAQIAIKGGTTEAALHHLNQDNAFCALMNAAILKAYERASALGNIADPV